MTVSILFMVLTFIPTGDAESASRIRLPEVVELSQTMFVGKVLEIERTSPKEQMHASHVKEERFKVKITRFLRGAHRIDSSVFEDGTLWLSRKISASPRASKRLRRAFPVSFKAEKGAEGVFFLQGASLHVDATTGRKFVGFDWAGDPQKMRKLPSILRKVLKAEGIRTRANSQCRYATYELHGKCLSARDVFRSLRCPKGSSMHDSKYRDFGLELACKTIRGLKPEGPTYRWTEYGQLESKTMMSAGLAHGLKIYYGFSGLKRSGEEYVEGRQEGRIVTWHPNGKVQTEGQVVGGLMDGDFHQYSQSGKLLGTFVMTQGTGTLKRWRDDGSLQMEAAYIDGKSHGVRKQFYANGQMMSEGVMVQGKMDGLWLFYGATGAIDSSVCYEASPTALSRQLWRHKKMPELTCPPGPNTAKAE